MGWEVVASVGWEAVMDEGSVTDGTVTGAVTGAGGAAAVTHATGKKAEGMVAGAVAKATVVGRKQSAGVALVNAAQLVPSQLVQVVIACSPERQSS